MLKEWAVWHSGCTEDYNTQLAYYPRENITICVLMNLENGGAANLATCLGRDLFKRKAEGS